MKYNLLDTLFQTSKFLTEKPKFHLYKLKKHLKNEEKFYACKKIKLFLKLHHVYSMIILIFGENFKYLV